MNTLTHTPHTYKSHTHTVCIKYTCEHTHTRHTHTHHTHTHTDVHYGRVVRLGKSGLSVLQCVVCVAVCCGVAQCVVMCCRVVRLGKYIFRSLWDLRLQHTATHCNTLRNTATHCNTLQHTATHCNTATLTATTTLQLFFPTCTVHLEIEQEKCGFARNPIRLLRVAVWSQEE